MPLNKGVKHLVLADNQIGSEGVISLSEGLKRNTTLKSLFLQGNPIGEDGVRALVELLKVNKSISKIDIRDIDVNIKSYAMLDLISISKHKNIKLIY